MTKPTDREILEQIMKEHDPPKMIAYSVLPRVVKSYKKTHDKIMKQLKTLPINCGVCGKRLTMSSSGPDTIWGCSGMLEGDKYGWIEGRKPADKHYTDSRLFMDFKDFHNYERIEVMLKGLLK